MNNQYSKPKKIYFTCDFCYKTFERECVIPKAVTIKGYKPIYACNMCARIMLVAASACRNDVVISQEDLARYFPDLEKEDDNA